MALTAPQADVLAGPLTRLLAGVWSRRQSVQAAPEGVRFRRLAPTVGRRFKRAHRLARGRQAA
jgi:hypothetical protein